MSIYSTCKIMNSLFPISPKRTSLCVRVKLALSLAAFATVFITPSLAQDILTGTAPLQSARDTTRDPQAIALVHQSAAKSGSFALMQKDIVEVGTITNVNDNSSQPITVKTSGTGSIRNEIGSD